MTEEERDKDIEDLVRFKADTDIPVTLQIPVADPDNPDEKAKAKAKRARAAGLNVEFTQGGSHKLIFFGTPPKPPTQPGEPVMLHTDDGTPKGQWQMGFRAITGPREDGTFLVCTDAEWEAAQAEGREPEGAPWPLEAAHAHR